MVEVCFAIHPLESTRGLGNTGQRVGGEITPPRLLFLRPADY
jgi:hypothetical protein